MRLLVVEDHPELGPDLKKGLEHCHYAVDLVTTGEDALALGETIPYDLIILDILLPGLDGRDICRQLREQRHTVPILFLTALGEVEDRVRGLDLGADDYLAKPFAFRELEAQTPQDYVTVLEGVNAEAERLGHLISDLLALARGDEGRTQFEREPVRLDLVVGAVAANTELLATECGIILAVQESRPVTVLGDEA